MADTERSVLCAQLLGKFQITSKHGILDDSRIRSDMMTKLLSYMICHRQRSITIQELSEALWPDDRSDNPAGALKNLMYRLRNTIKKEWGEGDYILTGRGCYQWNPRIPVEVDAEKFDMYSKQAKQTEDQEIKMDLERKAIELYKGKFLPEYSNEYWIMSLGVYYHSTYLSVVKELAGFLDKENRYAEMENICQRAIALEPLDEELYCCLLKSLIRDNKQKQAAERYRDIVNLLYDELGVRPSGELQNLYDEMMKQQHEHQSDISVIQRELKEERERHGAFLCDYGIFKKTYELEVRRAGRLGISVFLSLLSLYPEKSLEKGSPAYLKVVNDGMEQMERVLLDSLRFGDVVTRYSVNQYLVMLPGCQYEDAKMVLERIQYNFYSIKKHAKIILQYGLDEMEMD